MNEIIAIIGPTAVGKTALSFKLAERFQTELVSADAYQVYKGMDIGTAKATKDELATYRHHLIDIIEPNEDFSAAAFQEAARTTIEDLHERGTIPILVGGTGLYSLFWKDTSLRRSIIPRKNGRPLRAVLPLCRKKS